MIAHIMHDSVPMVSGYSIRGKYIVETQKKLGFDPFVITSPAQTSENRYENINGIDYFRVHPENYKPGKKLPFLWRYPFRRKFREHISKVLGNREIDLIHAHEVFNVSQVALDISEKHGKKLVLELRGVVEDSDIANNRLRYRGLKYMIDKWEKTHVMKKADAVVTISTHLKEDLVNRGISSEKIFIVPNGVDSDRFNKTERNVKLVEKYGVSGCKVLGYVGSLRKLEGLDLVVLALKRILKSRPEVRLFLIGRGPEKNNLMDMVKKAGVKDNVIFIDNIEHDSILDYYSLIDIIILPRIKSRVNELVTPLKPLEAMAAEKCVLASDVGGLRELINDNTTGMLFQAENSSEFVEKALALLNNREKMRELSCAAKKWVAHERDWKKIVEKYREVYRYAMSC